MFKIWDKKREIMLEITPPPPIEIDGVKIQAFEQSDNPVAEGLELFGRIARMIHNGDTTIDDLELVEPKPTE